MSYECGMYATLLGLAGLEHSNILLSIPYAFI